MTKLCLITLKSKLVDMLVIAGPGVCSGKAFRCVGRQQHSLTSSQLLVVELAQFSLAGLAARAR